MLKNRVCYLFILLCTTAFYICFNGYQSTYVFCLSLALPVFSLLLSLPGMLTLHFSAESPGPGRAAKFAPAPLRIRVWNHWPLPCGRARVTLCVYNSFTGEERRERLEFTPGKSPLVLEHVLSSNTCGLLQCRLKKAGAYDLLGLVWLPVRLGESSGCEITVLPAVHDPMLEMEPGLSPRAEGEQYSPHRPGDDPSELFGLREYQPGDRLSHIDWKLSQKSGGLLVRQASLPITDQVLLLADISGQGEEADAVMDILATVSDFLAYNELGHILGYSGGDGLMFTPARTPEEARPAIEAMLSVADRKALPPLRQESLPEGVAHLAYICAQPDGESLGALEERYRDCRITVLHIRPCKREGGAVQWVRVRIGHISEDLDGLRL